MAGNSSNNSTNSNSLENTTNLNEINSNHPLYLHQTDHLGLFLISKKLTGCDNYSSWKRSLMIALNGKNKMKVITREFVEPRMDYDSKALWERNNDKLISWILNTGTSSITKYFHGRNQLNASSEALDEKSVLEGIESRPASHQFERGAEEIPITHDLSSFDRFETACKDEELKVVRLQSRMSNNQGMVIVCLQKEMRVPSAKRK
ncbi:cysteine-rich receptor-like protein kinase 8 [Tanacetum coccineum]